MDKKSNNRIFGKVIKVSNDGNLIIRMGNEQLLEVDPKYCSILAENYVGDYYTFLPSDIINEDFQSSGV